MEGDEEGGMEGGVTLDQVLEHVMGGGGLHVDPTNHGAIVKGLDEAIESTKYGHLTVNQVLIQHLLSLVPEGPQVEVEVHGITYRMQWRSDGHIVLSSPNWEGKAEEVFRSMDEAIKLVHDMEFHELVQQEAVPGLQISPEVVEKAYILISKLHQMVKRGHPISVPRCTINKILQAFMTGVTGGEKSE